MELEEAGNSHNLKYRSRVYGKLSCNEGGDVASLTPGAHQFRTARLNYYFLQQQWLQHARKGPITSQANETY